MQPESGDSKPTSDQIQQKKDAFPGAIGLVVLLGLLAAAALIICNNVFVIKTIQVEGNRLVDAQTIINLSGISIGSSMFSLNTPKIKAGINSDPYLTFEGIWKTFPDNVLISVKEDTPRLQMQRSGMLILIGENGVVLEETSKVDMQIDVPMLTGISRNVLEVNIGQPLVFADSGLLEAMNSILTELTLQNVQGEISELNVASLDNLYLLTVDGLQVMLGDATSLPLKIAQMVSVLSDLRIKQIPIRGGILDVSTGKFIDYRPPA